MQNTSTTEVDNIGLDTLKSDNQYFTFILNEQEYGVDILRIQEIKGWSGVRKIPRMPVFVKGVIDLRGVVVPIIDLRERFGMQSLPYNHLTVVVILKVNKPSGEQIMGLIVDAVSEVYDISAQNLKPPPDINMGNEVAFVKNLATVGDKMIIVLDVDVLLGTDFSNVILPVTQVDSPQETERTVSAPPQKNHSHSHHETQEEGLKVDILQESFNALAPRANELVSRFYEELFLRHPEVKPLFAHADLAHQKKKLVGALQLVVNSLRNPEGLAHTLAKLGEKHQLYGAIDKHYDAVAHVMLFVMREMAGDLWTKKVETAWKEALSTIKQIMLSAYRPLIEQHQIELMEKSFDALAPRAEELVAKFYSQLFKRYPAVKPMFENVNPKEQKRKLVSALKVVINNLRAPEKLVPALRNLGAKHQEYGATEPQYDAVADTLLDVMEEMAGDLWTSELEQAWSKGLGVIKQLMISGYTQ